MLLSASYSLAGHVAFSSSLMSHLHRHPAGKSRIYRWTRNVIRHKRRKIFRHICRLLIVRRKGKIGCSASSQETQSPHRRGVPESNSRLAVEAVICGKQRSCFQRMCTSQITSGAKPTRRALRRSCSALASVTAHGWAI